MSLALSFSLSSCFSLILLLFVPCLLFLVFVFCLSSLVLSLSFFSLVTSLSFYSWFIFVFFVSGLRVCHCLLVWLRLCLCIGGLSLSLVVNGHCFCLLSLSFVIAVVICLLMYCVFRTLCLFPPFHYCFFPHTLGIGKEGLAVHEL
jgi:hypothetical protein